MKVDRVRTDSHSATCSPGSLELFFERAGPCGFTAQDSKSHRIFLTRLAPSKGKRDFSPELASYLAPNSHRTDILYYATAMISTAQRSRVQPLGVWLTWVQILILPPGDLGQVTQTQVSDLSLWLEARNNMHRLVFSPAHRAPFLPVTDLPCSDCGEIPSQRRL